MRYSIALRASHENLDATMIVDAVGLDAHVIASAGKERQFMKTGKIGAVSRTTYVVFQISETRGEKAEITIGRLVRYLAGRREEMAPLRLRGVNIEIFIGLFIANDGGLVFDELLLREIVDLKLSLSFDLYVDDDPSS